MKKFVCFLVLLLLLCDSVLLSRTLYFKGYQYPYLSEPDFAAEKLGLLKKGSELLLIKKQGDWANVHWDDKTGWIPLLFLSDNPVQPKAQSPRAKFQRYGKQKRSIRTRTVRAVIGVKGLSPDKRKELAAEESDFEAVKTMEEFKVNEETGVGFVQNK